MAEQQPPPSGIGRGGRGARLLAALQQHHRRPGEQGQGDTSERAVPEPPISAAPVGRGALLSQLLKQAQSHPKPSSSEPPHPQLSIPMGRGAQLQQLLKQKALSPSQEKFTQPSTSIAEQGALLKTRGLPTSAASAVLTPPISLGRGGSSLWYPVDPSPTNPQGHLPQPESLPTERLAQMTIKGAPTGEFKGSCGSKVNLNVNYVRLHVLEDKGVFEYHVSFNPEVDSKSMRFRVLNQSTCKEVTGSAKTFDGAKLYLPMQLPQEFTDIQAILPTDGTPVLITLKFIRKCNPRDCLHFYNVLLRKAMNMLNMVFIQQHCYDPSQKITVSQHKLEIWPGFITAIHEYDGGLMLNCDASFKVLRKNTVHDILYDLMRTSHTEADLHTKAVAELCGCVVMTGYNKRVYRIDDIDWNRTPKSTFECHTGQEISFMDYYKRNYGVEIKDDEQPLLIHRAKRKRMPEGKEDFQLLCLIPELCLMTGLTDDMRSDFRVMKDLAFHTRISPTEREQAMTKFVENINTTPETTKLFEEWGVKLESGSVGVVGRVLPPEKIIYRNQSVEVRKEADWSQELSRNSIITPIGLTKWVILFTRRDASKVHDFVNTLKLVGPPMGIEVREPLRIELRDDRTDSYLKGCRDNITPSMQLIVAVFPTLRDDRYSALKKLCCADRPIPSQVINAKTINQKPKLRSITQKIALQINCKLGGELWAVDIPLKKVMVCGIDVYHDPTRKGRSVLGFVSSINQRLTRWYSQIAFQEPGQELGDCLKAALLVTLKKYHEMNHFLPEKIFVYRDGVSDGQLAYVTEYEVEQMRSCFQSFTNYSPMFTMIVVQKKINTKIFLSLNSGSSFGNPIPGTILDHSVTRKNMYDFFLVSQHVRQGTVSPTHYIVVRDTSCLQPDQMQRLSYKLTHMYYNWSGTIRVPAPCQYAHKLAYLVGQNIRKVPNDTLLDKLFFL